MPRPTPAQLSIGTFTVVAAVLALLAASGATGPWQIAVLVAFALLLGTLTTALLMARAGHSRPVPRPAARQHPGAPARHPEYARQR